MTLIVEQAPVHTGAATHDLFAAVTAPLQFHARGSIVALDAVDAIAGLRARCVAYAGEHPEMWGASVAQLFTESVRHGSGS